MKHECFTRTHNHFLGLVHYQEFTQQHTFSMTSFNNSLKIDGSPYADYNQLELERLNDEALVRLSQRARSLESGSLEDIRVTYRLLTLQFLL